MKYYLPILLIIIAGCAEKRPGIKYSVREIEANAYVKGWTDAIKKYVPKKDSMYARAALDLDSVYKSVGFEIKSYYK